PGDKLLAAAPNPGVYTEPAIPTSYEAGELIGHTEGTPPTPLGESHAFAFDYAVYDLTHENQFVNIQRYRTTNDLANSLHAAERPTRETCARRSTRSSDTTFTAPTETVAAPTGMSQER